MEAHAQWASPWASEAEALYLIACPTGPDHMKDAYTLTSEYYAFVDGGLNRR